MTLLPFSFLLVSKTSIPDPIYTAAARFGYTYTDRFRTFLQGRRNPGQRLVETGLWDEPSETTARAIFTTFLQTWLRPGNAP